MWTVFSDPRSLTPPADLSGREAERLAFLSEHGFGAARREPVSGDASTRAYERLHLQGRPPLIFMDAPPAAESGIAGPEASTDERVALGYNAMARLAASRVDAFAAVAGWLRSRGLSAPQITAMDADRGFAVLEDLGSDLFVNRLAAGEDPFAVYGAATDLLVALHAEPPPASLPVPGGGAWPLLPYDALALKTGVDLFLDWWPKLSEITPLDAAAQAEWLALWAPVLATGETGATVFTHRDYHAENLLWLPEREGAARVGLLDFQDAVRGHPAWDLIHLLQDARRDVAPEMEAAMIARYLSARPDLDGERFRADYAALGALNAARILGPVFARQIVLFGRDKYRAFLPRTWRALERNLDHPGMAGLKAWFDQHVPGVARA
ncbi:phosphotransferase [soil metagenome]